MPFTLSFAGPSAFAVASSTAPDAIAFRCVVTVSVFHAEPGILSRGLLGWRIRLLPSANARLAGRVGRLTWSRLVRRRSCDLCAVDSGLRRTLAWLVNPGSAIREILRVVSFRAWPSVAAELPLVRITLLSVSVGVGPVAIGVLAATDCAITGATIAFLPWARGTGPGLVAVSAPAPASGSGAVSAARRLCRGLRPIRRPGSVTAPVVTVTLLPPSASGREPPVPPSASP